MMKEILEEAGVNVELLHVPGGGHGPTFANPPVSKMGASHSDAAPPPDYIGATIKWFDRHLLGAS